MEATQEETTLKVGEDTSYAYIDRNLSAVKERLAEACRLSGRDPSEVTLMAAIKSADVGEINYLHRTLGVTDVGENRVQQLLSRWEALDREGLRVHFIGTLQTNKVKYIIDKVDLIQSLDSMNLAREIEKQAAKHGKCMDVLIEINSGSEEAKSGVLPEEAEAFALAVTGGELPHVRLCGFMTMAPKGSEEEYRRTFAATRELAEHIWKDVLHREDRMILSMGMSESYVPAAREGATLVRVGRGLFVKEAPGT